MLGIQTNPDCAPVLLKSSTELPEYLVGGTLYRTGPGGVGEPSDKVKIKHFFDGLSQNHRFHIKDRNTVEYTSRTSCGTLKQMYKEGSPDMNRVTTFGPRDPCQTYFQKVMTVVKMPFVEESNVKTEDGLPADIVNVGVTIKRDASGLTARTDSNVFQTLDPVTLEPLTKYNYSKFSGQRLDGQMTASHVEFSLDGKTEYNYNLKLGKKPEYVVFSKTEGHITELARFEAPGTYLHSFWTTDNYVVLALWQAEFWGGGVGVPLNKNVLQGLTEEWNSERETVFYVFSKDPSKSRDFKTYKGPAFFAFHTINAFEEDGELLLDVCTYENHRVLFDFLLEKFESDMLGVQKNKAFVTRFKLHDGVAETVFCYNTPLANLELPTINPRFQNKKHRYVYGVNMQDKGKFLFEALVRIDSKTGETLYFMEEDETPGEALFVPDPEADEDDELAGVLLSVSLNLKTGKSSLLVLDPATMTVKAKVQMNTKVNYGFHGSWGNMPYRWQYSLTWDYYTKQALTVLQQLVALIIPLVSPFASGDLRNWVPLALLGATYITFLTQKYETELGKPASTSVLLFWLFEAAFVILSCYGWVIRWVYKAPQAGGSFILMIALLGVISTAMIYLEAQVYQPLDTTLVEEEDEEESTESEPRESFSRVSPYDSAHILSRAYCSWIAPFLTLGNKRPLKLTDMPPPPEFLKAEGLYKEWVSRGWSRDGSLLYALIVQFFPTYLVCAMLYLISTFTPFIQPFLLRSLIIFVDEYLEEGSNIPLSRGISLILIMIVTQMISSLLSIKGFLLTQALQTKLNSTMTSLIHAKALSLSAESVSEHSIGEILTLMTTDIYRISAAIESFDTIWKAPLEVFLCWSSMYFLIGNAMWLGIVIMCALLPITAIISKIRFRQLKQLRKVRAKRYDATNDAIINIKSIKLYAWESLFAGKVMGLRSGQEVAMLRQIVLIKNIEKFIWKTATSFSSAAAFAWYVLVMHKDLTTEIAFPALSLFGILLGPFGEIPYVLNQFSEAKIALDRIEEYLRAGEVQTKTVDDSEYHDMDITTSPEVILKKCSFTWDRKHEIPLLTDISMNCAPASLTCIVGRVGSGKTGLLMSILGETFKSSGTLITSGSMAYVSQQPWIFNATVRDNILFGSKFDQEVYDHVIDACALAHDLELLPDGDLTEVGEKGISLSGGQKARLALARAVYSRADIIILDDVLAAVDEHVQSHLIRNVVGNNGLLSGKTRILATNTVGVLKQADHVIWLEEGRMIEEGQYDDLIKSNGRLTKLVEEYHRESPGAEATDSTVKVEELKDDEEEEEPKEVATEPVSRESPTPFNFMLRRASTLSHFSTDNIPMREDVRRTRISDEVTAFGRVKSSVFYKFFAACGLHNVALFLIFNVLANVAGVGSTLWLKKWGEEGTAHLGEMIRMTTQYISHTLWKDASEQVLEVPHNLSFTFPAMSQTNFAFVYFLLGLASGIFTLIGSIAWFSYGSIAASQALFKSMLAAVLASPMSFFEGTPIGRITNRFSSDIATLDHVIPFQIEAFIGGAFTAVASILVIAWTTPVSLCIILPTLIIYRRTQLYYVSSARQVRRINSSAGSPVISHFQECLTGLSNVRAFGKIKWFKTKITCLMDTKTKTQFISYTLSSWLTLRLGLVGALIVGSVGIGLIGGVRLSRDTHGPKSTPSGQITAGTVGLAMTYALRVASSLSRLVRLTIRMETQSVAVERVIEYCELPPEGLSEANSTEQALVPSSDSHITFDNYSTRYRPHLDLILKDLSFSISRQEKIGVVGRTGAGKSSLTLALFRIIEAAGGSIQIDSNDISTRELEALRSGLSIIPQDAQIFEGSLRDNLDPRQEYDDQELWAVLKLSLLEDFVSRSPEKLEMKVAGGEAGGGGNLSVGQKQLICLARALLNPSPILVLDEATASVDIETDAHIQRTIRSEFKHKTIITIAHRLNTVIDSDKILVLDQGRVAEFDSPQNLLEKEGGHFWKLCKQAGLA
ncbi:Canalicular multispecific organic anion transporter 1 [Yarrowia sp. B02]|nr:Canalicular multispecific organic anion transporter 1 [Yarrowia sp. B02]